MLRPLLTTACLLGLAACQSPITAPPPADGTSTPRPAAQIQGRASYLERIAPPPGAVLSVQLVDLQLADTPAAVIASADFRDLKGPPFAFALPYDPSKLRPNGMYGLHAGVRDAQGRLWFVTDTQVPVTPGTDAPVEFRMVRVAGEPAAAMSTPWQCGDQRVSARFDTSARGMMLEIDGNTLHQITPGETSHQTLIRAPFHDDGTPSLVAGLAQRIVRLGQQGREIIIAITTGDPDHGECTALTHGIDHQIGDTAIDQLRQILEL